MTEIRPATRQKIVGWGFFLILSIAFLGTACRKKETPPRNIILITLDTQRADHISAYKKGKADTPSIDRLASKGLLFENAWSLIPITLPAHLSMFYSLPPHALGIRNNGQPLPEVKPIPSLARRFRDKGFRTAAFVSLGVLGEEFGLADGFEIYDDDFFGHRWYLTADEINARVFPWIDRHAEDKFFLWLHYSDPHEPYATPDAPNDLEFIWNGRLVGETSLAKYEAITLDLPLSSGENRLEFRFKKPASQTSPKSEGILDNFSILECPEKKNISTNFSRRNGWMFPEGKNFSYFKSGSRVGIGNHGAPTTIQVNIRGRLIVKNALKPGDYRKEVEYLDAAIGRLWKHLESRGLTKNTAILLTGDHGEGLGEYPRPDGAPHFGHISYLYKAYLQVPLILYLPGSPGSKGRSKTPVSHLDIAPTISNIMGLGSQNGYQGQDLLKLRKGADRTIFMETFAPEAYTDRFAALKGNRHLIFAPAEDGKCELFDLDRDPEEKNNLAAGGRLPDSAKELRMELEALIRRILSENRTTPVDPKAEEMLKSLGYLKN